MKRANRIAWHADRAEPRHQFRRRAFRLLKLRRLARGTRACIGRKRGKFCI